MGTLDKKEETCPSKPVGPDQETPPGARPQGEGWQGACRVVARECGATNL
jgi:hypothetical protein